MSVVETHKEWLGKTQNRQELLTQVHIDGLNALLDRQGGQALGLQWLLCQERTPQSELGPDGHAAKGGFLPPVSLPRRMWAAGDITFHGFPLAGQVVERISRVSDIQVKNGRSGQLVFVRVDHEYIAEGYAWLNEKHTIVYREAVGAGSAVTSPQIVEPDAWQWRRSIKTDSVQLFRYSALTFNGHRIHYDQKYVTEQEGYPGLVVHGPLMATWLMNFASDQLGLKMLGSFAFRVHAPVFSGDTIELLGRANGDEFELIVIDSKKHKVISATASAAELL